MRLSTSRIAPTLLIAWIAALPCDAAPSAGPGRAVTSPPALLKLSVTPSAFNPTLEERVNLTVEVARSGTLAAAIVDRDGYTVRTLASNRKVTSGKLSLSWDGRDDRGTVVPDEAYVVRLRLRGDRNKTLALFDPLKYQSQRKEDASDVKYSSVDGVLTYTLSRPGRVHVEAGQAPEDPRTKQREGPVLKVIVDRAPRPAGKILERWDGWDESRTVFVPELPDVVFSVAATPLPDSAIIAVGNRERTFLAYAAPRPPRKHTSGTRGTVLNAFEDSAPRLRLKALAAYDAPKKRYVVDGKLTVELELDPARAPHFVSQPTEVQLFLNEKRILTAVGPISPARFDLDEALLPQGEHRLAANWYSKFGPATVATIRLYVPEGSQKALK